MEEILCVKNVWAFVVCGFLIKTIKKGCAENLKRNCVIRWSYLLNSTANPAHFHSNYDGLAVLFIQQVTSKQLPLFFHIFSIFKKLYFIKNPQTTNAHTFLTHSISAIGGVAILTQQDAYECLFSYFLCSYNPEMAYFHTLSMLNVKSCS